MGTRCESHRKEGLLSTPTNQKKMFALHENTRLVKLLLLELANLCCLFLYIDKILVLEKNPGARAGSCSI